MTNNKIYFVANWKMYGDVKSVNNLNKVINLSKKKLYKNSVIVYCPPFTILDNFVNKFKKTRIYVGAQDCYSVNGFGAFTGNISAKQLKKIGVKYVIIGHSEKRNDGDTDKIINKKIKNAQSENLTVILCVGETLKEKKNRQTTKIINNQIIKCLGNKINLKKIIIAYEPVWSIGTGVTPTIEEIYNQILKIKYFVKKNYNFKNIKVLYGGSVNTKNIKDLSEIDKLDGFLIGGASQKVNKFIDIVKKTIN